MVAVRESFDHQEHEIYLTNSKRSPVPMDLQQVFEETIYIIEIRVSIFVWEGFFSSLTPISFVNDELTVAASSPFHKDWVMNHYWHEMKDVVSQVLGRPAKLNVIDKDFEAAPLPPVRKKFVQPALFKEKEEEKATVKVKTRVAQERREPLRVSPIIPLRAHDQEKKAPAVFVLENNPFNAKYSFDSFVPGPSNQMAFTACSAIADQKSAQFSPLFLFGPVGIGKTHLIHAIGLSAKARNPNMSIVYMSAEQWVNAYIQAIRERRFDAFRKKFRSNCDILLIDDIQFLAGKDASQDEFFHTFNSLHQARKQIVLTSDKYPHEIQGLEERLRTRLSWGLVADIRPPEIETRIAILYKKAESLQIELSNEVAYYLAAQVSSSVRELEGALLRLSVYLSVTKTKISLEAAKEYLSPMFKKEQNVRTSAHQICDLVCKQYNLTLSDLTAKSRQQPIALARQVAMFLCRVHLSLSLPEIGRFFGGRDHSTVLSSVRKIKALREKDMNLQAVISRLEEEMFKNSHFRSETSLSC